ncbi:MAG: sensor histidine kinase [Solirubrobacteraceae bacterium]
MSKIRQAAQVRDRCLDPALAAVALVAFEIEILTSKHRSGPVVLNVLGAAAITVPLVWRRRAPLAYACPTIGLAVVMTATLTDLTALVVPPVLSIITAYTVAAYEPQTRAVIGLAVCLAAVWGLFAATGHTSVSHYALPTGVVAASWAVGRALRAHRLLDDELGRKAERVAAERESRELLAVADERTRIARELHAVVAGSVSAMVVQTETALRLLDEDLDRADASMAAVEEAGRETLSEMRRILGVLRRVDEAAVLAPQPGVGQIPGLVERAREQHRQVELEVDGDPGPLPASVDLGVYRILEEALAITGAGSLEVRLTFAERDLAMDVISHSTPAASWPTLAMRERVALCDGELEADEGRLRVRLPRAFEEVLS